MSDTSEREEFNCGEDSEGLWYVAVGNEQIVWDLSPEQAEKVCAQLKSATSSSDARYQARVLELEEALSYHAQQTRPIISTTKALSTTTPDTAHQRKVLEARLDENTKMNTATCSATYSLMRAQELRAQLASLNRNETLGE